MMTTHSSGRRERARLLPQACSLAFAILAMVVSVAHGNGLTVGYYSKSCPSAEEVVRKTVVKALGTNRGLAAGLIRMHFHDCFVRGCDASVLLDSIPGGNTAEKDSGANNPSLRGFEIIDDSKSILEARCPGVVSCADILAFAARDAVQKAGGFYYRVPAGRRDGRISMESDVATNLPSPDMDVAQLQDMFGSKGLSLEDMVTLSGAHTLGVSHCSSFADRVYNFNNTNAPDQSMDPKYVNHLRTKCPNPDSSPQQDPTVPLDPETPTTLDNKYYAHIKYKRGLLASDQVLMERADTARMVLSNVNRGSMWLHKFSASMVRMGAIDVLTGSEGEIRKSCRVVN